MGSLRELRAMYESLEGPLPCPVCELLGEPADGEDCGHQFFGQGDYVLGQQQPEPEPPDEPKASMTKGRPSKPLDAEALRKLRPPERTGPGEDR